MYIYKINNTSSDQIAPVPRLPLHQVPQRVPHPEEGAAQRVEAEEHPAGAQNKVRGDDGGGLLPLAGARGLRCASKVEFGELIGWVVVRRGSDRWRID